MDWRGAVKRFGKRFAISLLVLGVAYLLIFGLKYMSHNIKKTPSQKIAYIRSLVDESYFTGLAISNFKESSAVASYDLSNLISQFNSAVSTLQSYLPTIPATATAPVINNSERRSLTNFLTLQTTVKTSYATADGVLDQAISYDPSSDIDETIPSQDPDLLTSVNAAKNGLSNIANNQATLSTTTSLSVQNNTGANLVVEASTRATILSAVSCLTNLANQINAQQYPAAGSTRSGCINSYGKVRAAAISNELDDSYNAAYVQSLKTIALPLLKSL